MDHLSSSSSSAAGTTTYTRQSVSTFQQDVPKQTYTTAGTIYNPSSAQPLQPPVRRGRTLKWPPPGVAASELSLFPKSVLAGLPIKSQNLVTTPTSPRPPQIPKYSPLQQNYDRAVSPLTENSLESPNELDGQRLSSSSLMSSYNMDSNQTSPVAAVIPTSVVNKHADANSSDDEDDESFGENPLRGLTVKSLHNLASYPNPNQKRAQRALLRARPGATPAPSAGNISRTATPSYGAQAFEGFDIGNDGSHSPGLFRSAKTDPNEILKMKADRSVHDLDNSWRINCTTPPPGLFPAANIQRNLSHAAYKSTLATGPGAPRPLTAGPPGQRQYRTSTFETTIKALNNGLKEMPVDGPMFDDAHQAPPCLQKNMTLDALRFSGTETPSHLTSKLPSLLCGSTPDTDDCYQDAVDESRNLSDVDMEKILEYIKLGQNMNEATSRAQAASAMPIVSGDDWQADHPKAARPPWTNGTWAITVDALRKRNERTSQLFYAGTGALGKSMESVAQDSEFRSFKRQVGVIGDRRPKVKPEKVEYPPISVHQVSNMPAPEAAAPLITLAYSALVNHEEGVHNHPQFHQWKDPEPHMVDTSTQGLRSVFGQ
ncbi:hypothetical protein CORC01_01229 [Colletotrichum orchidophilum]|uniref:Uncharacterized protein n=1 Tax=Colletotrichum orchidophilum TaxID=1209926 RepID=A0A1G4BPW5_9PEZI|nr:uncharacterized protein CORC01_01229 [Colletotrichum orchidophilum]OHF03510.1 hypothetical protein CORC01_01229 [Colletotrichum orchidophilum]